METGLLPSATLTEFYRFALLLTGQAVRAEQVMASALTDCERRLGEVRDVTHRAAGLAACVRQRCLENQPAGPQVPRLIRTPQAGDPTGPGTAIPQLLQIEAYILAQHFQALPEPERSALALFYLDMVSPAQIAQLLEMDLARLSDTLGRARTLLQESLRGEPTADEP